MRSKIKTRQELIQIVKRLKSQGKKIVTTNGAFDILHVGHIKSFEKAKKFGDFLIVGVNTDDSVRRYKGPKRPINKENDRVYLVAALAVVDYITLFAEDTPVELLEAIKPDVHVKAADYDVDKMPETPIVRKHGGQVIAVPLESNYATTDLIGKILKRFGDGDFSKPKTGEHEVGK